MATAAGSVNAYPFRNAKQEGVTVRGLFTIDATGVVTASDVSDSGITLVRTAPGTYTLTYPAPANQAQGFPVKISLFHGGGGTPNISFCYVSALTLSTSTAVLRTTAVGAPFTAVDNTETTFQVHLEMTLDTTAIR